MRILTHYADTSTSKCIGDPKTPLCAVETLMACRMGCLRSFCEAVGREFRGCDDTWPYTANKTKIKIYTVETPVHLTADNIPWWAREPERHAWEKGDVLIRVRWQGCEPEFECLSESRRDPNRHKGEGCPPTQCYREATHRNYVLRKEGGSWRIAVYYRYSHPTLRFPKALRKRK